MVNLQIKGYVPPDPMGYGTWEDITPSEGIKHISTERNIDGGDSATIVLSDDIDFADFESQRAIQIFLDGTSDPGDLIWEGFMLNPELGVHSPWANSKSYQIQCVGYEKFLMRKEITREWTSATFNTIFVDLADEANADMRFPTSKRFMYDTAKLTNYDSDTYTETLSKAVENQKIFDVLKEMVPILDGINTVYAYEYGFYLDYMQATNAIYLMPTMLNSTAAATTSFADASTIHSDSLTVKRNFDKMINFSKAIGDGYETSPYNAILLSAADILVPDRSHPFAASGAPTQRSYIAIEIQNDDAGNEFGAFEISGFDAIAGNALSETIYFYAPFSKTTTIYSYERYADFSGATPFTITNMSGATINVYQCDFGIAGKSIQDYGICQEAPRRLDLDTQDKVDNFAQQKVRLYHKPVHEASFRTLNYNTTDYINKTVDLTDPYLNATTRYLVTKQKYIIPENYDVEQWLTAIYRDYDWE